MPAEADIMPADFCRDTAQSKEQDWFPVSKRPWNARGLSAALLTAIQDSLAEAIETQEADCAVDDTADLEVRFLGHAAKWERDTRFVSSMSDIVGHPSYKCIIAMGQEHRRDVLRLLLRDLRETERPWFTALALIAGTNPANPTDAGRVDKLTQAWIKWGKKEGLL